LISVCLIPSLLTAANRCFMTLRAPHPQLVTRAGRLSDAQARAIETLGPRFCIPYKKERLDIDAAFGRHAPTVFEIGFGMGETSAKISASMPEKFHRR
jgi:tRNA G46 methylase TrmB